MSCLARIMLGEQIGTANPIAMGSETAIRAAVDAPLRFVTLQAAGPVRQCAGTGLAGIGLFHQGNGDTCRRRLIGDILALPSMRPEDNFLLALGVEPVG